MNLIFAGRPLDPLIEQLRSRSCTIEVLPLERIVEILREEKASRVVDAIVASHIMHSAPPHVATPGAFYTFERRDKLKRGFLAEWAAEVALLRVQAIVSGFGLIQVRITRVEAG